jgi:hypothetical protein
MEDETLEVEMDRKYGRRRPENALRPRKPRNYSHLHADLEHTAFTQYNVRKGQKSLEMQEPLQWSKKCNSYTAGDTA